MIESPPQQLQSVGDLIGRAVRLYRQNISTFFQALLWPTVLLTVFKIFFQWGVTHGSTRADLKDWAGVAVAVGLVAVGLVGMIVASFFIQLRQLAFVRMANGFAKGFADAYAYISARKWKILGLLIVTSVLYIAAMIFWIIEMAIASAFLKLGPIFMAFAVVGLIVGCLGFLACIVIGVLVYYLAYSIVACEDYSIGGMISRSFKLLFQDFWRSLYFGLLLICAVTLISYPLALPMVLLTLFEFFRQGMSADYLTDPSKMPFYWMVLNQIWESLVNIVILWPIAVVAFGLYYYDLRMRQEAVDLVQRLKLMAAEASPLAEGSN